MKGEHPPAVFVSHGAPTTPLEDIPARDFLKELGRKFADVRAILCISAHWETEQLFVSGVETPSTIHDFYGFPDELYKLRYPAKGSPDLARKVASLLIKAGLECEIDESRGLDHGAWVPLLLMFPKADKPVFQLSIQHHLDPACHLKVGKALSGLREEEILVLWSGGALNPLGIADFGSRKATDDWALAFDDWLIKAVTSGDSSSLVNYRKLAPYPEQAHPRPDHYMPILSALGAGGRKAKGRVLHHSWYDGDLGMGAYSFQP